MLTEQDVIDELSHFYRETDAKVVERPPAWQLDLQRKRPKPFWRMQVLAVAAVLLLVLVAGLLIHEARLFNRNAPVKSPSPNGQSYQIVIGRDAQGISDSIYHGCDFLTDTHCPAALVKLTAAVQRLLDDLNTAPLPPRLAAITGDLRLHLAAAISYLNAGAVDFQARNEQKLQIDIAQASYEGSAADTLAADISQAHQATLADYQQTVAAGRDKVLNGSANCPTACQHVLTQDPSRCMADPRCLTDANNFDFDVVSTLASFAGVIPPATLSTQDLALQNDLSSADLALRQMITALSPGATKGDEMSQISSAQSLLVSALNRFRDDAKNALN